MVAAGPGAISSISNWVLGCPQFIIAKNSDVELVLIKNTFFTQWIDATQVDEYGSKGRELDCVRVLYQNFLKGFIPHQDDSYYKWKEFEKLLEQSENCEKVLKSSFFCTSPTIKILKTLKDHKKLDQPQKKSAFCQVASEFQRISPHTICGQIVPALLTEDLFVEVASLPIFADFLQGKFIELRSNSIQDRVKNFILMLYRTRRYSVRYHLLLLVDKYIDLLSEDITLLKPIMDEVFFYNLAYTWFRRK
jgi:hypothetical protein